MGMQCFCLNDYQNKQHEFLIGSGVYSYKKIVFLYKLINIYITKIFFYIYRFYQKLKVKTNIMEKIRI